MSGLFFVMLAILGWGIADFLIQRSARKFGDWEALFFITAFASLALVPFVSQSFATLSAYDWFILIGAATVILVASLLDFEALRVGKIAVIEPIYAMEVVVTISLATLIVGEFISAQQFLLILVILAGVFLVANKHIGSVHRRMWERGIWTAIHATIGMGASNFLYGYAARETDPLIINWVASVFMASTTLGYLLFVRRSHSLFSDWRRNKFLILGVGFFDILAWVAYAWSALSLPLGIATGLTESYVALAAVLGIVVNKERLVLHQKIGLVLTVVAAVALAFTLEG